MNKKQLVTLILAVIAFAFCIFFNVSPLISAYFSKAATVTAMVDLRPMLAELVVMAVIFGMILAILKTPKKKG